MIASVRHRVTGLAAKAAFFASQVLTEESIEAVARPTMDDVLQGGRFDVVSIGFVLALWSGSRALNVFVDTITIPDHDWTPRTRRASSRSTAGGVTPAKDWASHHWGCTSQRLALPW